MKASWLTGCALLLASSAWAAVDITSNLTLDADVDWREQGTVTVAAGVTLDIAGHRLSLSAVAGTGTITDSAGGGVVYLHVPRGVSAENTGVLFSGQLRFIKDGGGSFRQSRNGQTYSGGTQVAGGTLLTKYQTANGCCFGASNTEILVDRGATLDLTRSYDNTMYNYVLNGGKIREYDWTGGQSRGHTQISKLKLLSDSYMDIGDSGFLAPAYAVTEIDLGGHELAINCTANQVVFLYHTTFTTEGTVRFTNAASGYFQTDKTSVDGSKVKIINPGTSRFSVPTTFRDFEGAKCDTRVGLLTILGRYKSTGATIPNVQLANGATLDLTNKSGAWDLTASSLGGTISYANGATVTVDLDGRTDLESIAAGAGYVLKWASAPTATLVPDPVTATAYTLTAVADGLKLARRADIAKTATWTGAANDGDWTNPANWTCTDFNDAPITAVPGSVTAVNFADAMPLTVAAGTVAYGKLSGTINLAGDADWRGLSSTVFADGCTLDLKGHKLTLIALRGITATKATITDSVGGGELHLVVDEGAELVGDKVRLAGSLKVVKEGKGMYNTVLTGQTYTGGTDINAGTLKLATGTGNAGSSAGAITSTIRVATDAVLDYDSGLDTYTHPIVLAGGDFINHGTDYGNNKAQVESLTLEADAVLHQVDMIGSGYRAVNLDLGGHTLTVEGDENYLFNIDITGGGTIIKKNGRLVVDKVSNGSTVAFRAPTVKLDLDCILWAAMNMEIGDLTMRYTGTETNGLGVVSIHGTYLPLSNYQHNFKLLDGAALDLSTRDAAFALTSPTTGKTLEIASAAKILVKLGERTLTGKAEKLVAWTKDTKPDASVKFNLEPAFKEYWKLSVREDGLYALYNIGLTVYVR